jgi:hypothetical protein
MYLWQLPQNILAWFLLLYFELNDYVFEKRKLANNVVLYFVGGVFNGVSLGNYIFLNIYYKTERNKTTIKHEAGHCIQSRMLGWLYLIVIGIPSFFNNRMSIFSKYFKKNYYKLYPEQWADKLGEVKR